MKIDENNPIVKKIREAGGTVLTEPIFNEDGSENKKGVDMLLDWLEKDDEKSDTKDA